MSLCVAWKYEDQAGSKIYFASDSCAVCGQHVMPFGGIKVLTVPVRVISAFDSRTSRADVLLTANYGMAFVGHYLAAFLMKELVSEVLSHTQFPGPAEEVSFDMVCELVRSFHGHFYSKIRDHLTTNHELDFFLGGFCPRSGRVRVAKFSVDRSTRQPAFQEILQNEGFSFETIGVDDGQARFKELMELSLKAPCRTHFASFRRLWDIIRDPDIRFVAGAVQYGEFENNDFKLAGAFDLQRKDETVVPRTFVRGTDVESIHNPGRLNALHIHYSFGNPFVEDIQSFDATRSFYEDNLIRRAIDEQITVVPHSTKWDRWFQEERDFLRMEGISPDIPIEHVGSAAVAGLASVPVVDILVGAPVPADVHAKPFDLQEHGYEYLGDRLIAGARCYRKRGRRAFNLLVTAPDSEFWRRAIQLREYLRQKPEECDAYAREKMRILNTGSWTLARYLNARSSYFDQLLARATRTEEAKLP